MAVIRERSRAMGVRATMLSVLLALFALSCSNQPDKGPPETAEETPSLTRIDRAGLSALRDSFNTTADRARILVMLSPT